VVSVNPIELTLGGAVNAQAFKVFLGDSNAVFADSATVSSSALGIVSISPETLSASGTVSVTALAEGEAELTVSFYGGNLEGSNP
jgi:hypothetical protein